MKISLKIPVVIFLSIFSISVFASDFCNGFERGYVTGHKQTSGSSFDPFTPFCPFQPFKRYNDPESDFEHGYVIGYEKGLQEGRK